MNLSNVIELREVIGEYADKDINFSTAYKFMKIIEITEKDYQFYLDKTKEVITAFGRKDEKGELIIEPNGSVRIDEKHIDEAQEKMDEMAKIEIEIPEKYFIKLEDLEELKISCRKMRSFMPIIID
jgi:hypothetical protein